MSGFSNETAARVLLDYGLKGFDASVFLDAAGRKLVLTRGGGAVVSLERSGVDAERRFTFFDHVHTTGTDVPQPPHARAALTIGKDMSFRDLAQVSARLADTARSLMPINHECAETSRRESLR